MHDFSQHLHHVTTGQNTQGIVIEGHTDGMQLHRMQLN
jgi:flagellar motor protein MotB